MFDFDWSALEEAFPSISSRRQNEEFAGAIVCRIDMFSRIRQRVANVERIL